MNSSNGSASSPMGVARPESSGTPLTPAAPISTLWDSLTFRKLGVSTPWPWWGMIGGFMCRSRAHCVVLKKGAVLMSEAPARDPSRRVSSLINSLRMMALQRLRSLAHVTRHLKVQTYFDTCGAPEPSGKGTSSRRMLANVALRFLPLKGVVPYNIS